MDFSQALTASIESALNRYLSLDPEALPRFASLEGKIISLEIKGLNQTLSLFPSADGFLVLSDYDGEADACISATPVALVKLGLADDSKDLLFSGEIELSGDTRLASQFSRLFSQLDIDWEELLAQNIGDIAAHKIGNALRGVNQWFKRSTGAVSLDAGEYLQEEAHLSPSNAELRKFIRQVDELREGVDRLTAKIDILKNNK